MQARRSSHVLLSLAGLAAAGSARAQTSSSTIALIEEIEVAAPRAPRHPDPSASTSRLAPERLERARSTGEGLAAAVGSLPGARVVDLGGPGAGQQLTVRGGSPAQAAVLIDGLLLESPFATGVDLGLLDLEAADSVELLRGGAGAVLGAGAFSGALLVHGRRPAGGTHLSFGAGGGSFGEARLSGVGALPGLVISGTYQASQGDFRYLSRLGGLPDEARERRNNNARRLSASLRWASESGGARLLLGVGGRSGGVPGLETQPHLLAREDRLLVHGQLELLEERGPWSWAVGFAGSGLGIDYDDPDPAWAVRSRTRFLHGTARARVELEAGAHHLAAALSGGGERAAPLVGVAGQAASRGRGALSLQDEVRLGWLHAFGALRLERVGSDWLWLPRLGLRAAPAGGLELWAALGRSARAPTLDELHHPIEAGFAGNAALAPESAWELELGGQAQLLPGVTAVATAFGRRAQESILYLNQNAFLIQPVNVGASDAAGGELELSWSIGQWVVARWAGTAFTSRLAASGAPLPGQPRLGSKGELAWRHRLFTAATAVTYSSAAPLRLQGSGEIPPYMRWDASLSVFPVEGLSLSLLINNIADRLDLVTVHKIPLPGRSLLLSLRLSSEGA